ncbi:hypothetical protein HAV22_17570 [Massilia sp. TW-1]|uniref:Secreted protein n=1 Tax=Telluria antibiotica TaxID=2717319 RepID=A0ABX0PG63_9BURK|nr:hypothetical protein [Telluria antibiotica]NIA55449.1 hypothetical protein [Telluria antibiotica]
MKWKTVVPACAALGLVVVLVAPAWRAPQPAAPAPASIPVPAAPSPAAGAPAWLSDVPAPAPVEPLAHRIDRLAASGDARDAYRAWWLLHACVVFERTGRLPERDGDEPDTLADPAHACATLNERTKMARIDHLERAARAGVDGALAELVEEGPFGDPTALMTRPDDPLVKEWKARVNGMLSAQAEDGYWSSLYQLFTGFWFGHPAIAADRQSALAYGIALRDIMVKLDGVPEPQAIPFNGPFLDEIGTGLTQAEKARAQVRADAIVARAADQRGRYGSAIANPVSVEAKK